MDKEVNKMEKLIRKDEFGCVYVTIGKVRFVFKDGRYVYMYHYVNPVWE